MTHRQTFAISADLTFSAEVPGHGTLFGTLRASGERAEVDLSGPLRTDLARTARTFRGLAGVLARAGLTVVVRLDGVPLLEVGDTRTTWWQRILSRSRHVRVIDARKVVGLMTRRHQRGHGVSVADLLPPLTVLPLAPTFAADRRPVTTTHDPRRGGNPRLVLVSGEALQQDQPEVVFPLRGEVTVIGSGEACDIRIAGLEEIQAEVVHDERDELIVRDRSVLQTTRLNGAPPSEEAVLRTGARITAGEKAMLVYRRAEYADHGRPFGGRVGGELGHQRSQPDLRLRGRDDR